MFFPYQIQIIQRLTSRLVLSNQDVKYLLQTRRTQKFHQQPYYNAWSVSANNRPALSIHSTYPSTYPSHLKSLTKRETNLDT